MGINHYQVEGIFIARRWHSKILGVSPYRGAECDTFHYLVAAKIRKRLFVSKQVAQKFDMEKLSLKKLNKVKDREQYQLKIKNRFAVLENLSDTEDINRVCKNIKRSIKTSAKNSLG